jgi:hypothetical protein
MALIFALVTTAILFSVALTISSVAVYGALIGREDLDAYLGKYIEGMVLNTYNDKILSSNSAPRYVAMHWSIVSKWHVEDYGTIPRWSPWSRKLDAKREELLGLRPKKTLKDL